MRDGREMNRKLAFPCGSVCNLFEYSLGRADLVPQSDELGPNARSYIGAPWRISVALKSRSRATDRKKPYLGDVAI